MTERTHDFRGFDDWIEIFRAGTQTDSKGVTRTFTAADLDQMIANHSAATAAPIVIGHPAHNDPAYGWTSAMKRDGDVLLGRFRDVHPEFAKSVEAGHYRGRSVRIAKGDNGWFVDHVGFLGAKRPAIPLAPLNYAAPTGEVCDFMSDDFTPGVVARLLRRMREFFIEKFSLEEADRVLPDWDIEGLTAHAERLRAEPQAAPAFSSQDPEGDTPMSQFTQADLDRVREEERARLEAEFAARQAQAAAELQTERRARQEAEFAAFVREQVEADRLTPAQAEGAAQFMLELAGLEQPLTFMAGDGGAQVNKAPLDWFREFVAALPRHNLTQALGGEPDEPATAEFSAPAGYTVDAAKLATHRKALAYMRQHQTTDYQAAVRAVEKE